MATTWFITGVSKGFGREWAEAALERGDNVAGTARRVETLDALVATYGGRFLPLTLDVNDRAADFVAVQSAADNFGRLDIVVNNAGYGHFGMVEELSEADARNQMETNLFGPLWVTQAALPIMRAQGSGHIIQVSSMGGVNAYPTLGMYHASKWGLEGFTQALAAEVKSFGIDVTLVEPGGYTTDWLGPSAVRSIETDAYADLRDDLAATYADLGGADPHATRAAILRVVDAEQPPLRVFFGRDNLPVITAEYASRLQTWNEWNSVALEADGR